MKAIKFVLSTVLAAITCNSMAQGIIIYKSNGTQEKLPYIAVDSIIPYFGDKEPEQVEAKAVDLGLPSGTLWASHNIGATAPEEHGGYYAFGETEEKLTYSWSTYMCTSQSECATSADPLYTDGLLTYANKASIYYIGVKCNIAGTKYDVATQTWGDSWMMPTAQQFQELFDNCTRELITVNDVICVEYTGPNGNSLIIPTGGGYKDGKDLQGVDDYSYRPTCFWVADFTYDPSMGGNATVGSTGESAANNTYKEFRYYGKQVRAVKNKQ